MKLEQTLIIPSVSATSAKDRATQADVMQEYRKITSVCGIAINHDCDVTIVRCSYDRANNS